MRRNRTGIWKEIDWVIIGLYLIFVLAGWLNIYAASYSEENSFLFDFSQAYGKQLIWILSAIFLGWLMLMLDFHFYRFFAYPIFITSLLLLIGVLIFGKEIKGAQSWFVIGPISIQPSEFAKFATALALANYLSSLGKSFRGFQTRSLAFLIIAFPAALIMLQPDMGSTLVFASLIFVLYREGLSGNILLLGLFAIVLFILALLLKDASVGLPFGLALTGGQSILAVIIVICLLIYLLFQKMKSLRWILPSIVLVIGAYLFSVDYVFNEVLSPHQQDRINELLGIKSDPTGAGYNVHQSKIAIGSGGFVGKGFLNGTQTKYDFVPEQNTDFIFCTIGEEWGFIGSFILIALYITFLLRLIYLSERQRSSFARIYGYCVIAIFFIHFAINIGMTIGLAPVIGIPLPFFSYGGSSLWAFTVLLFAFLKMDSVRKTVLR